jgi:nucleoside diphosphate kinase
MAVKKTTQKKKSVSKDYAVIFDSKNGMQLLNVKTDEVVDVAVLEGTARKRGKDIIGRTKVPIKTYGSIRIRSAGDASYDIQAPALKSKKRLKEG